MPYTNAFAFPVRTLFTWSAKRRRFVSSGWSPSQHDREEPVLAREDAQKEDLPAAGIPQRRMTCFWLTVPSA
jgi:hypothetical protein